MKRINSFCFIIFVFLLFTALTYAQIPRCPINFSFSPSPDLKDLLKLRSLSLDIPVAFHVIYATGGTGNISNSVIEDKIDVLNDAYSTAGVSFILISIDRTASNNWFNNLDFGSQIEVDVKQALTIDPEHVLNIYTANIDGLGWARLPWDYAEDHYMHGVVLKYTTLPG